MSPTAERIIDVLRRARLPLEDEKALQAAIAEQLTRAGFRYERERKITGGVIDFLVLLTAIPLRSFAGIEVKIKGGKRAIYRQCAAYCNDWRIAELIVPTGLQLALPPEINNKPVAVVDLGRAWL